MDPKQNLIGVAYMIIAAKRGFHDYRLLPVRRKHATAHNGTTVPLSLCRCMSVNSPYLLPISWVGHRVVRPWPPGQIFWPWSWDFWPWPWGFWPWPCVSGLGLIQSQGQGQSDRYSSKHSVSRYNYTYSTLVYQRHWYHHSAITI